MYKVVLVDDEKWILESLKGAVDWRSLGFEIVGEATNGAEALERIREIRPDVAFIDIRMPGMSGLELIGKLHEAEWPVQCVVASGYAEFEYAKQAMRYGVAGYCLKPFDSAEIREALTAAKTKIEREREALHNELLVLLQDANAASRDQWAWALARCGFRWDEADGAFAVVVRGPAEDGLFARWPFVALRLGSRKTAYLLNGRDRERVKEILTENFPPEAEGVGMSRTFHDICRIGEHVDGAIAASYRNFIAGAKEVGEASPASPLELDAEALCIFEEGIRRNDAAYVRKAFDSIELRFRAGRYDIRHAFRLYNLLLSFADRSGNEQDERYLLGFDDLAHSFPDLSAMLSYLQRLLSANVDDVCEAENEKRGEETFQQIVAYVRDHFRENLYIRDISRRFYIHPNHLSRLFKKQLGVNFTKYVTEIRMEHACELLKTTSLSVGEIAERAGYNDYFYFAKAFKKHTGCTPTEYRARESGATGTG